MRWQGFGEDRVTPFAEGSSDFRFDGLPEDDDPFVLFQVVILAELLDLADEVAGSAFADAARA